MPDWLFPPTLADVTHVMHSMRSCSAGNCACPLCHLGGDEETLFCRRLKFSLCAPCYTQIQSWISTSRFDTELAFTRQRLRCVLVVACFHISTQAPLPILTLATLPGCAHSLRKRVGQRWFSRTGIAGWQQASLQHSTGETSVWGLDRSAIQPFYLIRCRYRLFLFRIFLFRMQGQPWQVRTKTTRVFPR